MVKFPNLHIENCPANALPTNLFLQPLKTCPKPWIRGTDLSLASCLLAGQPLDKTFSFLKNQYCNIIGFYAHWATNSRLVTRGISQSTTKRVWQKMDQEKGKKKKKDELMRENKFKDSKIT